MYETVLSVVEKGFDLYTKVSENPLSAVILASIAGLLFRPSVRTAWRTAKWVGRKGWGAARYVVVTPEPGPYTNAILNKLQNYSHWKYEGDSGINNANGIRIKTAGKKGIICNGVDITDQFNRADRKRIFRRAQEVHRLVQSDAKSAVMVGL